MVRTNLEFRKVPSMFFLYEVNSNGTVVRNVKSKRHLTISIDHRKGGYAFVHVNIKKKVYRIPVARIVAECWLGTRPEGYQIDHINRNPADNDYRNLRYVTHSEQMKNRVLSQRIIDQATANCQAWNKLISKPVIIDGIQYESTNAGAKYIAELHGKSVESIRWKFKCKRHDIYGHSIEYRNAETRHGNQDNLGKE